MISKINDYEINYTTSLVVIEIIKKDCQLSINKNVIEFIEQLWSFKKNITKKTLTTNKKLISKLIVDEQDASAEEISINFLFYSLIELIFQLIEADGFSEDGLIDYRIQQIEFLKKEEILKNSTNLCLNSSQENQVREIGDREIIRINNFKKMLEKFNPDELSNKNHIFHNLDIN